MDHDALRQRIKAKLDQLVDELLSSPNAPQTLDQIEEAALSLRARAGEIVAEELAKERAQQAEAPANKIRCSCGGWARDKGVRPRQVVSMAGSFVIERHYFYCRRCDAGRCPVDLALGGGEGCFTRRVAQEVSRVSVLLPYAPAVGLLFDLSGVSVCAKEAQRLCEAAGHVAQDYLQERQARVVSEDFTCASVPDVLYLQADGVHTPIKGEATPGQTWREMKVGLARGLKPNGVPLLATRYVSHLGECETFGRAWAALATEAGVLWARVVVALGDGAPWIWKQVSLHFPWAIQILDFFHACEYLWVVGRAAFGEQAGAWVKARQQEMRASHHEALFASLHQVSQEHPAAREAVQTALGYFANNRERMDYARYEALGLSIGSGAAESGCKQVVAQRLKGAGMRWSEAGAQTVACLRCLVLSQEWARFIEHWNRGSLAVTA